jgi:uncharacterized membrane protein
MTIHFKSLGSILCIIGIAGCADPVSPETKPMGENLLRMEDITKAGSHSVDFAMHVKPILEHRCVMCHNRETMKGRMNLDDRRQALRTGAIGRDIVPGYPEISLLYTNMVSHRNSSVMPVVGVRATAEECAIIAKWIKEGAHWPTGVAGTLDTQQ